MTLDSARKRTLLSLSRVSPRFNDFARKAWSPIDLLFPSQPVLLIWVPIIAFIATLIIEVGYSDSLVTPLSDLVIEFELLIFFVILVAPSAHSTRFAKGAWKDVNVQTPRRLWAVLFTSLDALPQVVFYLILIACGAVAKVAVLAYEVGRPASLGTLTSGYTIPGLIGISVAIVVELIVLRTVRNTAMRKIESLAFETYSKGGPLLVEVTLGNGGGEEAKVKGTVVTIDTGLIVDRADDGFREEIPWSAIKRVASNG